MRLFWLFIVACPLFALANENARLSAELEYWKPAVNSGKKSEDVIARLPDRIILVRHGESEANVDQTIYERIPDNQISLTERGVAESRELGDRLKQLVGNETLRIYHSPYRRAVQTKDELLKSWGDRNKIRIKEVTFLREQDHGNYQKPEYRPSTKERLAFGPMYFRYLNGESGADVEARVYNFLSMFHRATKRTPENQVFKNVVVISHGITTKLLLKILLKLNVDDFHLMPNPANAEHIVLVKNSYGSYELEKPWIRVKPSHSKIPLTNPHGLSKNLCE